MAGFVMGIFNVKIGDAVQKVVTRKELKSANY